MNGLTKQRQADAGLSRILLFGLCQQLQGRNHQVAQTPSCNLRHRLLAHRPFQRLSSRKSFRDGRLRDTHVEENKPVMRLSLCNKSCE